MGASLKGGESQGREGRERKKERMKERKIRSGREGGAGAPTDMKSSSDMKASTKMKSVTERTRSRSHPGGRPMCTPCKSGIASVWLSGVLYGWCSPIPAPVPSRVILFFTLSGNTRSRGCSSATGAAWLPLVCPSETGTPEATLCLSMGSKVIPSRESQRYTVSPEATIPLL